MKRLLIYGFIQFILMILTVNVFAITINGHKFNENSANLTNQWFPMSVGQPFSMKCTASGQIFTITPAGPENVYGVECIKWTGGSHNWWLAQDTEGNIHVFKHNSDEVNSDDDIPNFFLPSNPVSVGTWSWKMDTSARVYYEVLSNSAAIGDPSIATYTNCLKISEGETGDHWQNMYLKKSIGFVAHEDTENLCIRLKNHDIITSKPMPWIPLLLFDEKMLTGTWNFYFTETGGEEQGPYEIGMDHEGNSLVLCDYDRLYDGIVNGNEVSIDLGWTQFVGTIESSSLMQGTYAEGTWRAVKVSDTSFCSELSFWDIGANGIPKFVTSDHIELGKIEKISKFRSGEGHDYSDDFESCRSMKHYYYPYSQLDWSQIKVFSPIDGTILKIELEGYPNSGKQVHIRSIAYPAFTFRIFHVNVNEALAVGDSVVAGQELGTHISNITTDDIAVGVSTPEGWKLVSFFSVMTDTLFQAYQNRGAQSRDDFIISKEVRDSDPLNCTGETFGTPGTIENWFTFQ